MTRPASPPLLPVPPTPRACEGWTAPDPVRVGRRLMALRHGRGWHERDVAAWQCDVDAKSLRAWEEGRWLPGGKALAKLAFVYGVTTDWILRGE